jgi:hypothetical protein
MPLSLSADCIGCFWGKADIEWQAMPHEASIHHGGKLVRSLGRSHFAGWRCSKHATSGNDAMGQKPT